MPIHEYCYENCGHVFEEWQSGFEEKDFPCPICKGSSKRIVSQTSFVLKGGGWYVTDYCNKHSSPGACTNKCPDKTAAPSESGTSSPGSAVSAAHSPA